MTEPTFTPAARLDDVPDDSTSLVMLKGRPVLLCRSEGQVFAIENRCSHAYQPLDCGRVKRGWIACPAHGTRFDLESGEPLNPPANRPIATFATRVIDGQIEVLI